jgi:peptidoglycan hydrolase CwlO-like protein
LTSTILGDTDRALCFLRDYRAPVFTPRRRGWRNFVALIINWFLRLLGRKQIVYNEQVIDILGKNHQLYSIMIGHFDDQARRVAEAQLGLEEQHEALKGRQDGLEEQQRGLEEQQRGLEEHERELRERQGNVEGRQRALEERQGGLEERQGGLEQRQKGLEEQQRGLEEHERELRERQGNVEGRQGALEERQGGLEERQGGLEQRQEGLERQQRGLEELIRLVHAEARDIALTVRTELGAQALQLKSDEMVVRAGRVKLSELPKDLRINVGCGHRPMDGYVNIDCRDIPEANFIADARALPFELGSVAELASSHLVEHFREHEFRHKILPYWRALLKPLGILRIICPNWDAMVRQLMEGRLSWARFKEITFGGQEYDGNDHFAMYTPESLAAALRENGFSRVETIDTERDNGGCPEMELIAVKDQM